MTTQATMTKRRADKRVGRPASQRVVLSILRFLASLLILLAIWMLFARWKNIPMLFPGPAEVFDALKMLLSTGELFEYMLVSLGRIFSGLVLGSIGGVLLGLLLGSSRIISGLLSPIVTLFRFVPPLAWYAPVLAWLGTGEASKIVLIVYTTIFVVAVNTLSGMAETPQNARRMLAMSGASRIETFFKLDLPYTLPYAVTGIRLAMGNAFMTVVTAEMLGAQSGLGVMIMRSMTTLNLSNVFVAILILGTLGLLADRLFTWSTNRYLKRFLPWTR